MRISRGSVRFALMSLAGLVSTYAARAQLLVATTPGEPNAIAHAELAYAEGAGAPVTWLSLRIRRGPVALVAALPKDATAEPALDAWFAALEATASPNVLLPHDATDCGKAASFAHVVWPRGAGVTAAELNLQAPDDVGAALAAQGLGLPGQLPQAERYLVWSWPASDTEQTTRTLRIEGGAAPLTFSPGSSFPVLVNAVTRGPMTYPAELDTSALTVTFVAGKPASDYHDRLLDWLDQRPQPLLEMRARGPLFDWGIYADSFSLSPLVRSYAVRAAGELSGIDIDSCSEQLRALRNPDAPAASACGEARDASLALAAAGHELATLQRFAVSATAGVVPSGARDGGEPLLPMLRAQRLNDSACPPAALPPIMAVQPPVDNGSAPSGSTTTVVVEQTVVVSDSRPSDVSCGGSTQPEPSYSSDRSGSTSCSSDTSSTSSSDSSSTTCSGNSSSSSDSSNGCSSDSSSGSSSDSSGSGCNGGSDKSSGYNGDTCSGSAAPDAGHPEKAQASLTSGGRVRGPQRLRTSLWSMALAAVMLPIRRRKRRQAPAG
jgi:hypothetical protein